LKAAWRLRELFYRLFSSVAKGARPIKQDLDSFVASYAEAIARGQFVETGGHYRTRWRVEESPDALLWPLIHSAGQLLQSEELTRVKECPGCGWLFLDTSKNQNRRWCSMNTCGARDKMRRYHRRKKEK
jgi:predicted RNA-binding Zn ribbon-like protein